MSHWSTHRQTRYDFDGLEIHTYQYLLDGENRWHHGMCTFGDEGRIIAAWQQVTDSIGDELSILEMIEALMNFVEANPVHPQATFDIEDERAYLNLIGYRQMTAEEVAVLNLRKTIIAAALERAARNREQIALVNQLQRFAERGIEPLFCPGCDYQNVNLQFYYEHIRACEFLRR